MHDRYEPALFEQKWRDRWKEQDLFRTREEDGREKFYGLDFFPYPSGAGLSVGHCRNYIPTDVLCRMKYMQGFNVLHPMGFDAFGLPAENEAIKNKIHPAPMIDKYAGTYQRQMELIGISYDWSREFKSSDPSYYKWTQWIFKLLYDRGLAERKMIEVNWDPIDKTVLAAEEIIGGRAERSGALVEKKLIPQWIFKITNYAQQLIDDLDELDWPEGIKQQQRNWIGRSEGVEFEMKVVLPGAASGPDENGFEVIEKPHTFRVFTTRIDTIFGMTFCVLAPEHPLIAEIKKHSNDAKKAEIDEYQGKAKALSDIDRQAEGREKTGVDTGAHAINPATGKKVPIFIADYVMMGYGTGAIMAVPAHDQRDFDFAVKFGLDVVPVFKPDTAYLSENNTSEADYLADPKQFKKVFETKDGILVNSGEYSGMGYAEGSAAMAEWIVALGIGEKKVNYKLRDWLISRQRYWGCPIPIIYDKEGNPETVIDDLLPVELPDVDNYEPSDDGSSPLSRITDWVNTTTRDGALGHRETDTLGGFACSSWYFLRFCDPHNEQKAWDPERVKYWMPVDCYVGGAEHAVMHLLYARFWTKVLYDAGLVDVKEPFARLMNQGQVLAQTPYRQPKDGESLGVGEDGILVAFKDVPNYQPDELTYKWVRMSKSKGNVVTPDEAVEQFGADALRVYELFVAPFEQAVQWSNDGMQGAVRFLSRVFRLVSDMSTHWDESWKLSINATAMEGKAKDIRRITHKLIRKATEDIERFAFNTYISATMTAVNDYNDLLKSLGEPNPSERLALSEAIQSLVLVLSPAAPHTSDEIWEQLGGQDSTYHLDWPKFQAELAQDDTITMAIQVNGKLRDTLEMPADASQEAMQEAALSSERVKVHTEGKTVRKVIVIPGKLVNIVAN
ncbi:MAG: leucine--tRNA ligase [Armatimonadetes bacterium]|nr:leucine--tRNA ligase [Armatimonadota bacterium]